MSTGHKEGEYYGGYTRTGWWKYDWEIRFYKNETIKALKANIYSFPLFLVMTMDKAKSSMEFRIPYNNEIRKHVETAVIENYVIESKEINYIDSWNTDFVYLGRRVPKKR